MISDDDTPKGCAYGSATVVEYPQTVVDKVERPNKVMIFMLDKLLSRRDDDATILIKQIMNRFVVDKFLRRLMWRLEIVGLAKKNDLQPYRLLLESE